MGIPALLEAGLDLLLPACCVGCDRPGRQLCPGCAGQLRASPYQALPARAPGGFPGCVASVGYRGVPRAALLAYKEAGRHTLLRPLARVLAGGLAVAVAAHGSSPVRLVAVPSSRAAVRSRGRDHLAPLLALACRLARFPPAVSWARALEPSRRRLDSVGLNAMERRKNAEDAFAVRPRARRELPGSNVLVVDDIVTSGATLAAASRVLRHAGARVVGAVVLAGA